MKSDDTTSLLGFAGVIAAQWSLVCLVEGPTLATLYLAGVLALYLLIVSVCVLTYRGCRHVLRSLAEFDRMHASDNPYQSPSSF